MSQFDWGVMDPNAKSGSQLAIDLNNFRDALNSLHRGITRPTYVLAGMLWIKEITAERWDVVLHDGQVDLVLRSLNPTTSELIPIPSSELEGVVAKDADTGAALIPGGNSAERPITPENGMLRHNTEISELERWQGGKWLPLNTLDKALNEAPMVTLASTATVNIGAAAANTINISGTIAITAFDAAAEGATRRLVFQGALTLTHNTTTLILPGAANIATTAGDVAEFVSLGSGKWKCIAYTKASGRALIEGGIGIGQTWNALNGSRVLNTTYTNSTPLPILVSVTISVASGNAGMQVDGVSVGTVLYNNASYNVQGTITSIVPPGSTYRVNSSGSASLGIWSELR